MENKLLRIATVLGAIGTIAFFSSGLGGLKFADKDINQKEHQEIKKEAQVDRTKIELLQNDVTYIKQGITEIKQKIQ